jgi:endonuclease I
MSTVYSANTAKAKLIYVKNKETYKIVIAFNVHKKVKDNGDIVHLFPTQAKCNYVSGDINYETLQKDTEYVIAQAKKQLRTDNIEFV